MRRRTGFALAAALLAMVLIAALIAGVFLATTDETRISSAAAAKEAALVATETAIELTIRDWNASIAGNVDIGDSHPTAIEAFGTPVDVYVTRLDSTLYAIVAEARLISSESSATRRTGAIVRVQIAADHSITIDRVPERWWSEVF
jgi:hypothetical protein